MNELFDKLIVRIVFSIFVCMMMVLYKYLHLIFYPSSRRKLLKKIYASKNPADTLHFYGRILGICIIFTQFQFTLSEGIWYAFLDFFIHGIIIFSIYLLSIYVIESITLYNFEYADEIQKRKNLGFAIICFANAISMAMVAKTILAVGKESFTMIIFLWLFGMVVLGFGSKAFPLVSRLGFSKLIISKNTTVAISYSGFIFGLTIIITNALDHQLTEIRYYIILVILKILLSTIIFPLFKYGILLAFKMKDELKEIARDGQLDELPDPTLGHGIFEAGTFLAACFLTQVITNNIDFGTFYPVF